MGPLTTLKDKKKEKKTTPVAISVFCQLPEQCYNCQGSEIANILKKKKMSSIPNIPAEF